MKNIIAKDIDFRFAPPSRWTCICRPDDDYKTLLNEKGMLLYDYFRSENDPFPIDTFLRTFRFGLDTGEEPINISQRMESARVPIVFTTISYPKVTLELIAFSHQHEGNKRTDVIIWSILTELESFMTSIKVDVQSVDLKHRMNESGTHVSFDSNILGKPTKGPLLMISSNRLNVEHSSDNGPSLGMATSPILLEANCPVSGAFILPLNHYDDSMDLNWAVEALDKERDFWNRFNLQKLGMEIPDPDVQDMLTACARNIMQAREIKDGLAEFQVGSTCYRGLWVVDGHFILEAVQFLGLGEEAARGIDALLKRVKPTGAIEEIDVHLKETGIALATFVRQCELTGDKARLIELWPIIRKAVEHIRHLREVSKERGTASPEYGLMPPSLGDGGLGGIRPEYTTALWTLVGLREVYRAAERIGQIEDAASFRSVYDDLMRSFREHAGRDMRRLPDGTPYLPMLKPGSGEHIHIVDFPNIPEPWNRANPATATWALAHAIYPGEIFSPDDPIVQNFCALLDTIDDDEGIPEATGWLPYKAVWNYAASFYAHAMLYAGKPEKAVDYLYAFANHAGPTRVWREEQSLLASGYGQKIGDMPHNWASAEFIRLVRNLIVFERSETLELLPALPPEWVIARRPVALNRTPTRFGPVSLKFESFMSGDWEIVVELDGSWERKPERIILHLLHFVDESSFITVNGRRVEFPANRRIDLDATKAFHTVRCAR